MGRGGSEGVSWVRGLTEELARNYWKQRLDSLPLSPQSPALAALAFREQLQEMADIPDLEGRNL